MTVYNGLPYTFTMGPKGEITATRSGPVNKRGQAISTDGGKTFVPHGSPALQAADMADVAGAYAKEGTRSVTVTSQVSGNLPETSGDLAKAGDEVNEVLDAAKKKLN